MNDKFIKYIDQRLDQWAKWYGSGNSYGLGYPRRSMLDVFMIEGINGKSPKSSILPCNEEAEEIESLVVEMEKQNKKMALILRHYYFESGALRALARSFSKDYSSVSYRKFKEYVDLARYWLAGRLSCSYGNKRRMKSLVL